MAVQVRAITSRPVRRRGMRPLVEAIVYDASGKMRATFFNQPWLVQRYPPGTHLLLHGKVDARGGFRVSHHALGAQQALPASAAAPEDGRFDGRPGASGAADATPQQPQASAVAHYPASEGVTSTQILTLVQAARPRLSDVLEPLPALARAGEQLPDRASALAAMHFPRDGNDTEAGRERLAFDELLLTQLVFLRRRARRLRARGRAAAARARRS